MGTEAKVALTKFEDKLARLIAQQLPNYRVLSGEILNGADDCRLIYAVTPQVSEALRFAKTTIVKQTLGDRPYLLALWKDGGVQFALGHSYASSGQLNKNTVRFNGNYSQLAKQVSDAQSMSDYAGLTKQNHYE